MEEKKEHTCVQETRLAILDNNFQYMAKEVSEIKDIMKEFIKTADIKFASKEELLKSKVEIEKLKKDNIDFKLLIAKWMGIGYILTMIIGFIVNKLF